MFQPELPTFKKHAIEGLTYGTVNKIYLEFDKPFWPQNWGGFSLLWTKADQEQLRSNAENQWLEDVFGFYAVDFQPNILCGWMYGMNARRMELLSEDDVRNGSIYLLRKFLTTLNIPDPVGFKRYMQSKPIKKVTKLLE